MDTLTNTEELKTKIKDIVSTSFSLYKNDIGRFEHFSWPKLLKIFKFHEDQYTVNNLCNLSVLEGNSKIGMNIVTAVFTPSRTRDIPLLIIDKVKMRDKITVFIEFYTFHMKNEDNIAEINKLLNQMALKYKDVENYNEKDNWYVEYRNDKSPLKCGTADSENTIDNMIMSYLDMYLHFCATAKNTVTNAPNEKLQSFLNDMITKGNPSTSILNKALGKDAAAEFSRDIVFKY